jgi:hypothetical protein
VSAEVRAAHLLALLVQATDKASQGIVVCDEDGTVLLPPVTW